MADANITKQPSTTVQNLTAPTRESGRVFKAAWKVPDRLKNGKYNDRATSLPYKWTLNFKVGSSNSSWSATGTGGMGDTSKQVNIANFPKKLNGRNVNRNDFYPVHATRKLTGVTFSIWGKNAKGTGKPATMTRKIETPRAPTISNIEHNEETGEVTARLVTNAGTDYKERFDTAYRITLKDSRGKADKSLTSGVKSTTSTDTTIAGDVTDRFAIKPGEYLTVVFEAWARGYAGDSTHTTKEHVIAFPKAATISYEPPKGNVDNPDSKLVVKVNTNNTKTAPVDHVQLEVLRSVDYTDAADAIASDEWEELDVVDDGQCTALVADIGDISPERGKNTWMRVKSWHDIKSVYYTNSKPLLIKELSREISAGSCEIDNPVPSVDGNSASIEVLWDSTGSEDADGTEISWSKDEDAWISTKQPTTFTFGNSWGETIPGASSGEWHKKATVVIKELDNQPHYVRARRYSDEDSGRVFGDYSPTLYVSPTEAPSQAVLVAPYYVALGENAVFSWGFSSTAKQDEWRLMTADGVTISTGTDAYTTQTIPYERLAGVSTDATFTQKLAGVSSVVLSAESDSSIVIRSSEQAWEHTLTAGTDGTFTETYPDGEHTFTYTAATNTLAYSLPDGFFADAIYTPTNAAGIVSVYVAISTGGKWVESPAQTVRLYEPPTLELDVSNTLTAQPLEFDLTTNTANSRATIRVFSNGSDGAFPDGLNHVQVEGDTVYSDTLSPEWDYENNSYSYTVTLPGGIDFRDNASYTIEAQLSDVVTELQSESVTSTFSVAWANQAQTPDEITVTPSTVTDADGYTRRIATIALAAPTGAAATSVYDVYRVTADRAQLIADSRELDETIIDEFAPFGEGETAYRICLRTIDGDLEWADYSYKYGVYICRFDFGGDYLEFPYTVNYQNRFTKDFERNRKMSGADDGFWNQGTERAANLSTDAVVFDNPAQIEKIYALARYAGAVLVRTPDGMCYPANVNVSGLEGSTTVKTIAVSFDAEEIELTDEFRIPPADSADEVET